MTSAGFGRGHGRTRIPWRPTTTRLAVRFGELRRRDGDGEEGRGGGGGRGTGEEEVEEEAGKSEAEADDAADSVEGEPE